MCMILSIQAKAIAAENNMVFDPAKFNFSARWLRKFKEEYNITRVRLHGEGEDASMEGVHITRTQLPPLLADVDPDMIYNFDETGESVPFSCTVLVCSFDGPEICFCHYQASSTKLC